MTQLMEKPRELRSTFTSTGEKLFFHQEAMRSLRDGRGRPITCHLMPTDVCNHTCAFCSVQTRAGDVLPFDDMLGFVDILRGYGLKSVIISGGGNPILYREPGGRRRISDLIDALADRGLDVGMITNGAKLVDFDGRLSYPTLPPASLDRLTWLRISMAGLDHPEAEVYVPDVDAKKTTLGFSYVYHDIYECPEEPHHKKVSTIPDLLRFANVPQAEARTRMVSGKDRLPWIEQAIGRYVQAFQPRYVRMLPNCLEPEQIPARCDELRQVAARINERACYEAVFVQYKPPQAPKACYLGYVHPVLNASGRVFPCDSCVLNEETGHKFDDRWSICHWSEIGRIYEQPVKSLIRDPARMCPGCVFTAQNVVLGGVVDGSADITPHGPTPEHVNFV